MENVTEGSSNFPSSRAEKISIAICDATTKIKVIELVMALARQLDHDPTREDVEEVKLSYTELEKSFQCNQEQQELLNDYRDESHHNVLYDIKQWSKLNWSEPQFSGLKPNQSISEVYGNMQQFCAIVTDLLAHTAKDWNDERQFVELHVKNSIKNAKIINKLKEEFPVTEVYREQKMQARKVMVHEIRERMNRVKQFALGDIVYLKDKTAVRTGMIEHRSAELIEQLLQEEKQAKNEVDSVRLDGELAHRELKERVHSLKTSIVWIVNKYDERMIVLQQQFDKTWAEISAELEKCRSLCIRYNNIKDVAENLRIEKRKRYEEETRKKLRMRLEHRAAIKIQTYWRNILAKRHAKKQDKKKKEKGKKKKK